MIRILSILLFAYAISSYSQQISKEELVFLGKEMSEEKEQTCATCKSLIPLHKHPMNKRFGKGKLSDTFGFVCMAGEITEGRFGIYFDTDDGICECYEAKN